MVVFRRDRDIEKEQRVNISQDFALVDKLYGTIRDLDTQIDSVNANHYVTYNDFAKEDSDVFKLNYGVRDNLYFYEMIPKIAILN
jgi:hypothetical protein